MGQLEVERVARGLAVPNGIGGASEGEEEQRWAAGAQPQPARQQPAAVAAHSQPPQRPALPTEVAEWLHNDGYNGVFHRLHGRTALHLAARMSEHSEAMAAMIPKMLDAACAQWSEARMSYWIEAPVQATRG